jgi:hypothetical protein
MQVTYFFNQYVVSTCIIFKYFVMYIQWCNLNDLTNKTVYYCQFCDLILLDSVNHDALLPQLDFYGIQGQARLA